MSEGRTFLGSGGDLASYAWEFSRYLPGCCGTGGGKMEKAGQDFGQGLGNQWFAVMHRQAGSGCGVRHGHSAGNCRLGVRCLGLVSTAGADG